MGKELKLVIKYLEDLAYSADRTQATNRFLHRRERARGRSEAYRRAAKLLRGIKV